MGKLSMEFAFSPDTHDGPQEMLRETLGQLVDRLLTEHPEVIFVRAGGTLTELVENTASATDVTFGQ